MLVAALTGGIATGKSVVARILGQKGCYIQNADLVAHELMSPGGEVWKELVGHFGQAILKDSQEIDRQKLAGIIFRDKAERDYLNRLTHPRILERVRQTIRELEQRGGYDIYITEAALVIEAGFHQYYDRLILTHCRLEVQVERLCRRDGISPEQALQKIKAQGPVEDKIPLAHYLIDTSGRLEETIEQTEKVYLNLYQDALLKKSGLL
ncbi:MAG: Dephospho-CoA kinase [Candidatus Saccharicenans subterraneus]|uniref:Dephospho-CoA kinase n=1 Tax=Candidatus Saccharicenans subterraneus TaxID=2508984 RepID=A0A3E2BJE5_9BACT|nr:MAG: Dephospho-CoA kinase [Candidatus Saccharicenans subterraneum]